MEAKNRNWKEKNQIGLESKSRTEGELGSNSDRLLLGQRPRSDKETPGHSRMVIQANNMPQREKERKKLSSREHLQVLMVQFGKLLETVQASLPPTP